MERKAFESERGPYVLQIQNEILGFKEETSVWNYFVTLGPTCEFESGISSFRSSMNPRPYHNKQLCSKSQKDI